MIKTIQCPRCNGNGQIPMGEHYVTRDMAIDAGCPEIEGQLYETKRITCPRCYGGGVSFREEVKK